jgi:ATP-dependent protease ClpP protease subunit
MARKWYAFKNIADESGEVELSIYDEIGAWGVGAKQFIAELKRYKGQHIHLRLNSPGGEIIEGSAIYNALTRHEGGLTVHIDALAASMASVIAMAGDPVYMADNALLMIHNPWTMAAGEAEDLRKQADLLDTMKSNLVRAYQKKTGMEEKAIAKLMDEETWLDATEAAALGFIDAIEDGIPAAASASDMRARFDNFRKAMTVKNSVVSEAEVIASEAPAIEAEAAPVVESVTDSPAAPAVVAEEPQADASAEEIAALKQEVERLIAESASKDEEINALKAEVAARESEAEKASAEFSKLKEAHAALERGMGVASASVVPSMSKEDKSDPVAEWMDAIERKDYAAAGKLYASHKRAIWAARERLSKATS